MLRSLRSSGRVDAVVKYAPNTYKKTKYSVKTRKEAAISGAETKREHLAGGTEGLGEGEGMKYVMGSDGGNIRTATVAAHGPMVMSMENVLLFCGK